MRRVIVLLGAATLGSLAMAAAAPPPGSDTEKPVETRGTGHPSARIAFSRSRNHQPARPVAAPGAEAGTGRHRHGGPDSPATSPRP